MKLSQFLTKAIDLGKMFGQLNWMIYLVFIIMGCFGDGALAMSVFLGMNLCDSIQSDGVVVDFAQKLVTASTILIAHRFSVTLFTDLCR